MLPICCIVTESRKSSVLLAVVNPVLCCQWSGLPSQQYTNQVMTDYEMVQPWRGHFRHTFATKAICCYFRSPPHIHPICIH